MCDNSQENACTTHPVVPPFIVYWSFAEILYTAFLACVDKEDDDPDDVTVNFLGKPGIRDRVYVSNN